METVRKKGHFTFRTAAVLLMASAALEMLSITSEVPLLGEIRGGVSAGIYHGVYAVLFLGMGVGLWGATKWGYLLVFITTAVYTLDKAMLLLSQKAMETSAMQLQGALEQLIPGVPYELLLQANMLKVSLFILGWWGFTLYTYWRRDYFKSP